MILSVPVWNHTTKIKQIEICQLNTNISAYCSISKLWTKEPNVYDKILLF